MVSCAQVAGFLEQARLRQVSTPLGPDVLALLKQLGLIGLEDAAGYTQLTNDVAGLSAVQGTVARERGELDRQNQVHLADERRLHSVLFYLEGLTLKDADRARDAQDEARLAELQRQVAEDESRFNELMRKKALLDSLFPFDGRYLALTGAGAAALRELQMRLYRVSDIEFSAYWAQSRRVTDELEGIAQRAAGFVGEVASPLGRVDRTYIWSIGIGLAKLAAAAPAPSALFLEAYDKTGRLSANLENRLLAAEVLATLGGPIDPAIPLLESLSTSARATGVPKESALGVAAILLSGRRADGSLPGATLGPLLRLSPSYEAAALLSIVNRPVEELTEKFSFLRSMFGQWGYSASEDVELSSAFLATSELPVDSVRPKLAILARGLASYLRYPLVASAILASIPVLEAHETLNLVESAYQIIGRRTGPVSQSELICLAVRMVHGVAVPGVEELDPAAAASRPPVSFTYALAPRPLFIPLIVTHGGYYSTFGGFGGAHPGHVHSWGGGFIG